MSIFVLFFYFSEIATPMTVSKDTTNNRSVVADVRETEVTNMLQKHWGSVRTVQIFREPNASLGISIVGGKVSKVITITVVIILKFSLSNNVLN